jgi:hypothetical protein
VDQQGHVYISGRDSHDIHRLSPDGTFRHIVLSRQILSFTAVTPPHHSPIFILLCFVLLVVLINCMDASPRRITTALPVHGTTVIHLGSLKLI